MDETLTKLRLVFGDGMTAAFKLDLTVHIKFKCGDLMDREGNIGFNYGAT